MKAVIEDEWPKLAEGEQSKVADELFSRVWDCYLGYEPQSESEKIFFSESVSKLNQAGELRMQRIGDAGSGIHPILWVVLLAGGVITIIFTFFFGTENVRPHIIMSALCAALIALMLFITLVLDYPFTGELSIKPDAFNAVIHIIEGS